MKYDSLNDLIYQSSSSRKYFLSLPVNIQLMLHEQNNSIHSLYELKRNAKFAKIISEDKFNQFS